MYVGNFFHSFQAYLSAHSASSYSCTAFVSVALLNGASGSKVGLWMTPVPSELGASGSVTVTDFDSVTVVVSVTELPLRRRSS